MKKITSVIISAAVLLSLLVGLGVSAAALESAGQLGETIRYTYDAETAALTISGSGAMADYGSENASPFSGDMQIKRVTLGEGITHLGSAAFENCSALESVNLPASVESIGEGAFAGCEQCVLICACDSPAHVYAKAQGIAYTLTDRTVVANFTVTLNGTKFAYSGKAIKPLADVWDDDGKPVSSDNYTMQYDSNPGAIGKHAVKLQFHAPYYGSKTRYYYVKPTIKKATSLVVGTKYQLDVYGYDSAQKKNISFMSESKFSSSNTKVATVSKSGEITALIAGSTTISVDTAGFVYTYTLEVTAPPIATNTAKQASTKNGVPAGAQYTYIELSNYSGSTEGKYFFGRNILAAKQSVKFTAYSFKSANTSIVKVSSDGTITAGGKAGTTTITVGAKFGGKVYTKTVYVLVKNGKAAPYYYMQGNYSGVAYDNPSTSRQETIASSGCGVCSTAMVVNNLAGKQLCTVASLARFALANKARDNSGTNLYTLLNAVCKANSHFSYTVTGDKAKLLNHLKAGGMAIINQGDAYSVFSSAGHFVVAYKQVGGNIEVFDPSMSASKYTASNRVLARTSRGCIVPIDQVVKATSDRNPGYYLITYHSTPLSNAPIQALDAKPKSTTKNYSSPVTMYCKTTGGLRFRKSPSTSAGLVAGGGGASIIGYRDAVQVVGVVTNSQGKWYKIQYRGYTGYASADYIVGSRPGVKTMTIPKGRRLRAAVGTSAKVLAITKRAYTAEVLVDSYWRANGYAWSRIRIGKKTYYVAMT